MSSNSADVLKHINVSSFTQSIIPVKNTILMPSSSTGMFGSYTFHM